MLNKLQRLDDKVLDSVSKLHSPARNRIMIFITTLGNFGWVWFGVCFVFLAIEKYRNSGVNIILSLIITLVLGEGIIKHAVGRSRPCYRLEEDEQIINPPKYYSFPSGHTASAFSVSAVVLCNCPIYVFLPVLFLSALIGFSRIYLRVHYLTDVIVGLMLGFGCGLTSVALYAHFFKNLFVL